jgi:hypothetical protein
VVDDLVTSHQDQGLGCHHDQGGHDPEEIEQGRSSSVPDMYIGEEFCDEAKSEKIIALN